MFPASFPESNWVLDKPPDMTREQCDALSVQIAKTADGFPLVISCWKLTPEELQEINRTGRIWLTIFGTTMPPVALTAVQPT